MMTTFLKRRSVSIAVLLTTAFTTLLVGSMMALFALNSSIAEKNLVDELTVYIQKHTESLGLMIQQDMLSGYYPAVIQKSVRFVENEDINHITIRLADGAKIFDKVFPGAPSSDLVKIRIPISSNVTGLKDKSADGVIGTIDVSVSFENVKLHLREQQRRALLFWCLCLFGIASVIVLISRLIAKPVSRLRNLAASQDLKLIADYSPSSCIVELRALESEFVKLSKKVLESAKAAEESARFEAIARTTASLAHDVRKPFSILNMGLGMLQRATEDPEKVKGILGKLMPEINKAIASVDGMVADVLEIGSASKQLIQEPSAPEHLIEDVLGEIFRVYPKSNIAISYDLAHKNAVNVHVQKVARVFSNIFGNAAQAMNYKGNVWFKTSEDGGFTEFTIGNAGSYIPPGSLPRLFEAFFTSGKKGGTGLGLAIAEKVVHAHGGKIWCVSEKTAEYPSGFVEFHFTLPIANQPSNFKGSLPGHSSDITKAILAMTESSSPASNAKTDEGVKFESDVLSARTKLGRPLKILIIDDESIYRAGLVGMLTHVPELAAAVDIAQAASSTEALDIVQAQDFDLLISDVDLGATSPIDGFELVEALRAALNGKGRDDALICVLSNRIVPSDSRTAITKGADAFISKPIGQVPLLKLLLQTFQSVRVVKEPVTIQVETETMKNKPSVAICEDNIFMLEAWTDALSSDSQVFSFSSPEDLIEKMDSDPDFLSNLACVVTDFHFDNSIKYDGLDVGKLVKSRKPGLSVLLSSDGETKGLDLAGSIDHVIAKSPSSLAALAQQYSI